MSEPRIVAIENTLKCYADSFKTLYEQLQTQNKDILSLEQKVRNLQHGPPPTTPPPEPQSILCKTCQSREAFCLRRGRPCPYLPATPPPPRAQSQVYQKTPINKLLEEAWRK